MREAIPAYMRFPALREMHDDTKAAGRTLAVHVGADNITRCQALVVDSEAVKKVKAGVYKAFSIGGKKLEKVANKIQKLLWNELSLCDRPVNPEAIFDLWKADFTDQNKIMKNLLCKALKLDAEKATDQEIETALAKALTPAAPDLAPLEARIAKLDGALPADVKTFATRLDDIEKRLTNQVAFSEEETRKSLIAKATAEGRIIPFDQADLIEKNGDSNYVITNTILAKAIAKSEKGRVPLTQRSATRGEIKKGANGKELTGLARAAAAQEAAYGN